jgi:cytoskeletal protein CcmA (bactofilin family)
MNAFGKRWGDKQGKAPSLLASGSQFTGGVQTDGPLHLHGSVRGDGVIGGELTISAGAHWHGDVQARSANISGSLEGNLQVAETLTVNATARIHGNVTARGATIATGALIDGELRITGGATAGATPAIVPVR